MFAVPKDTEMLVFTLPFVETVSAEDIEKLEAHLTEKTGIKCVVFDATFLEGRDFELRLCPTSRKQAKELTVPPGPCR